jgi:hypothetical protein
VSPCDRSSECPDKQAAVFRICIIHTNRNVMDSRNEIIKNAEQATLHGLIVDRRLLTVLNHMTVEMKCLPVSSSRMFEEWMHFGTEANLVVKSN